MKDEMGEQQCPCYTECQAFHKLVELKRLGLEVYCHRTRAENIRQDGVVENAENILYQDSFILHNKSEVKITTSKLISELETEQISCPRCRKNFEHAQELMKEVKSIARKIVMGICNHCRKKVQTINKPFCVCDKIVEKFKSSNHEQKEELKIVRQHSSESETIDPGKFSGSTFVDVKKQPRTCLKNRKQTFEDIPSMDAKEALIRRHDLSLRQMMRFDRDPHYVPKRPDVYETPKIAPWEQEKIKDHMPDIDIKISKPIKTKHDLGTPDIIYASNSQIKYYGSSRTSEKDLRDYLYDARKADKYYHDRFKNLEGRHFTGAELQRSVDKMSRKAKLDTQLAISKSWHKTPLKLKESLENVLKPQFSLIFPKVTEKVQNEIIHDVSSSQLIKDTQDKIHLQAEREKKRREEDHQQKLDQEQKKNLARDEKYIQAEEKEIQDVEDRKYGEEQKTVTEHKKYSEKDSSEPEEDQMEKRLQKIKKGISKPDAVNQEKILQKIKKGISEPDVVKKENILQKTKKGISEPDVVKKEKILQKTKKDEIELSNTTEKGDKEKIEPVKKGEQKTIDDDLITKALKAQKIKHTTKDKETSEKGERKIVSTTKDETTKKGSKNLKSGISVGNLPLGSVSIKQAESKMKPGTQKKIKTAEQESIEKLKSEKYVGDKTKDNKIKSKKGDKEKFEPVKKGEEKRIDDDLITKALKAQKIKHTTKDKETSEKGKGKNESANKDEITKKGSKSLKPRISVGNLPLESVPIKKAESKMKPGTHQKIKTADQESIEKLESEKHVGDKTMENKIRMKLIEQSRKEMQKKQAIEGQEVKEKGKSVKVKIGDVKLKTGTSAGDMTLELVQLQKKATMKMKQDGVEELPKLQDTTERAQQNKIKLQHIEQLRKEKDKSNKKAIEAKEIKEKSVEIKMDHVKLKTGISLDNMTSGLVQIKQTVKKINEEERIEKRQKEKDAKEMALENKERLKLIEQYRKEKQKKQAIEEKKAKEKEKSVEVKMGDVKLKTGTSLDNLILGLVQIKQAVMKLKPDQLSLYFNFAFQMDIISLDSQINLPEEIITDIIIGENIFKIKRRFEQTKESEVDPKYHKVFFSDTIQPPKEIKELVPKSILSYEKDPKKVDREPTKGVLQYALSDRTFIEKGWTMLPTEKVVRKMNVYRMRPARPEFDWFEHNKSKRQMTYDTGERLAEFDDNGRGRWYYRSGRLALDYYDAEETNAQQRFVVYSSGEPDERGRTHPITILATFDYLGNGIVFDHSGKIRLKYNQTEGVVLDRGIGPVSHWKWHTLNDPPVLQQIMIDTQMAHKDPVIIKLGPSSDKKSPQDNEEMLAIEFDNFIKEKSKKLSQKFKPFQIKMKALKINEHFSLKVLDQATVYLIFRDGSTNLKLNIGMILDHQEIVDTDTAEVGEVSNSLERFPARTDSLAGLQRSVAYAQRYERQRSNRESRVRPHESCSADLLTAAASPPMRLPLRTVPTGSSSSTGYCSRKPSNNLYYNTRLF